METIATRIMQVVEENGGNMSDFARNIEVTPAYISKLKNKPDSVPSTDVIKRICDKYNVREQWIRTGKGPMKLPDPDGGLDYINILMADSDSPSKDLIRAILVSYDRASPAAKKAISDYIHQVWTELNKRK